MKIIDAIIFFVLIGLIGQAAIGLSYLISSIRELEKWMIFFMGANPDRNRHRHGPDLAKKNMLSPATRTIYEFETNLLESDSGNATA